MNENETTKQDELDEEIEELDETEDVSLEEDSEENKEDTTDFEFEYDDEGNIVIPDTEDKDGDEEAETNDAAEGKGEETPKETTATETDKGNDEFERFKAQARETLEKMGVKIEGDDVLGGLVKLAAEADDQTPEEYLAKKAKDEEDARRVRANDLATLQELFPETKEIDDISKLPHFNAFAQARLNGADAAKAYRDTHFNEAVTAAVARAKKTSLNGTKDHLRSSVPKGAKDDSITMSKGELETFRETFPGMSDKEIAALYKKAKTK